MSSEKQIKTYVDPGNWKKLKDLLKKYDDTRKTSNAHYARLAFKLALKHLREKRKEARKKAVEFKQVEKEVKRVLND